MDKKVVLGLSGGVDSAVAARLLQQRGFEVTGLFLDVGTNAASEDAQAVADFMKIPLKTMDVSSELEENVCAPFVEAYLRGETPNPCIVCNPTVKFKALCNYADTIGAMYISTGHYARAIDGKLFKGEPENDQSYMLCRLTREQVSRLILPLGGYAKTQVRKLALELSLPVASKPDSMEICFIPNNDYASYIEKREAVLPEGNFVDRYGNVLGRHRGIYRYTVGQRRGLGLAAGRRVYVSKIQPETNEVVLSDGDMLFSNTIQVRDINWLVPQIGEFCADVRVRHSKEQTPARIIPSHIGAQVVFDKPVRAPTLGQTAVFYQGELLIGGGFIV